MPAMRSDTKAGVAIAVALLLVVTGCRRGDDGGELPDPAELLVAAADEMAQVETVAVQLEAETGLVNLPLRSIDGVVTNAGDAEGAAELEESGQRVEVQFVVVDGVFHYQLLGAWQQLPVDDANRFYDPSVILDPEVGVSHLLRTATDAKMVGRDGDTYEVTATFPADGVSGLLPGAPDGTPGTVWIGVDRPLLHRAEFELPTGKVTATLSDFDQPVEIRAP